MNADRPVFVTRSREFPELPATYDRTACFIGHRTRETMTTRIA